MTVPGWSTIGLFVASVFLFISSWVQARKRGKSFRSAVLPNALLAGAVSIIFAREFFADLPIWIDAPLAIVVCLVILIGLGLLLLRLRRYLVASWRVEQK